MLEEALAIQACTHADLSNNEKMNVYVNGIEYISLDAYNIFLCIYYFV